MSILRIVGDVHGQIELEDLLTEQARPYRELIAGTTDSTQIGDMGDGETYDKSSILGQVSQEKCNAYSATKSVVIGLARASALDRGPFKVTVNCIAPGLFLASEAGSYVRGRCCLWMGAIRRGEHAKVPRCHTPHFQGATAPWHRGTFAELRSLSTLCYIACYLSITIHFALHWPTKRSKSAPK